MSKLQEILRSETQSLKVQYIEKTKEWAIKDFERSMEICQWSIQRWCQFLNIKPEIKIINDQESFGFPKGFWNTKESKTYVNANNKHVDIKNLGLEKYISKKEKEAEEHYEYSIEKLALRIEQKGLDIEKLKVKTAHVKMNIETVLTDGMKTVKAFTILAWGEVNKPHYRYLIK